MVSKKSLLILILAIASVGFIEAKKQASSRNCFCTCNCGMRDAYTDEGEKPYYSEEGVEVMMDDGEIRTIHNFCDRKFYDRAKNQGMCSPNE